MRVTQATAQPPQAKAVPEAIYASQVDALFGDTRSLVIGMASACIVALITAFRSGEPLLFACAIAIGLTALVRAAAMRAYASVRPRLRNQADMRRWEVRYVLGASLYVAALGVFCLLAFWKTSDNFVHLISFSTILAVMIGVSGRNFSSNLLVNSQIICAASFMTLALAIQGGIYWAVTLLILLPFFVSLKAMATRLRGILFDAVIRAHDLSLLAARFDTALNNMPHGLAMFDAQRRLAVWNRRLSELLRLEPGVDLRGSSIEELLSGCAATGALDPVQSGAIARSFEERLSRSTGGELSIQMQDERTLAFTFQAMQNGGSVALAEDITERKIAEARIRQLARYDALTGLPNRTFLRDQMEAALATDRQTGKSRAIFFIDLDNFKQVNDTLGHTTGDKLLCDVGDRLRTVLSGADVAGRFGGDEFVLLHPLTDGDGRADAAQFAAEVIGLLSRPYEIEGHQVVIGTSVGIALAPDDGRDFDQLLKNADMALYRVKSEGRGAWRFFESAMDVQARARRDIELDLRNALADEVFELHYQPLYNLRSKRFSCCEALIRWNHPERGMIPPSEFVPIAEEAGLIVEIGNWVLREACLECAKWPTDMHVAVNISPMQFRRGSLVASVRHALAAAGLAPHRLEVEITESLLLQNLQSTRITLYQLRDLGVRISLDDFGTGYSSLSYLHSLPLHKVKIDRSFLEGLGAGDRSLVLLHGIARLSAELGLSVVVEGIETEEQVALVAAEGTVDEIQGYLFSRPLPSRDVRLLLRSQREPVAVRVA
jgi:diguanylate cyclase (GGDEF)-like protein